MPIRELIKIHDPKIEIHRRAFSTEFRQFSRDELQSVEKGFGHCTRATLGAIYDGDANLITLSERGGGRNSDLVVGLDPARLVDRHNLKTPVYVPGRSLFLGHYMNHYGHFLVETMARFWAVNIAKFEHYVFFPFIFNDGNIADLEFHNIIFDKCGIDKQKIIFLRNPTKFEEIFVPERLTTINICANIKASEIYRNISDSYIKKGEGNRIFLSRLQPYGRVENVPQVEEVFREFGFDILYPEILPYERQLKSYANCRIMAGFAGSALHNCVFCREGTVLIEIGDKRSQGRPLSTQKITNQIARVEERFVPYRGTPEGSIDIDNLRQELRNLSILVPDEGDRRKNSEFHSRSFFNHYVWPATMTLHLANTGDVMRIGTLEQTGLKDGHARIEGMSIELNKDAPFGIEYKILQHNNVWTDWSESGTFLGARGHSLPIKGYAVRLIGSNPMGFRCVCLGRFAGYSAIVEASEGEDCKSDDGAPLMAIQIQLQR
jgi:hypothetical protein